MRSSGNANTNRDRIATLWIRKKLKSLTGEQLALLAVVREEWLRVGLATRTEWPAVRRIVPAHTRPSAFNLRTQLSPLILPTKGCLQPPARLRGLCSSLITSGMQSEGACGSRSPVLYELGCAMRCGPASTRKSGNRFDVSCAIRFRRAC